MKLRICFLFTLIFCAFTSFAQPRYSPGVRADRETQWMTDSLHITAEQSKKAHDISLEYNQKMDDASHLPGKQKTKAQQRLERKKDADLKAILNKEQYEKYYRREKVIRSHANMQYKGPHQPL